jgi:hypothetical protein
MPSDSKMRIHHGANGMRAIHLFTLIVIAVFGACAPWHRGEPPTATRDLVPGSALLKVPALDGETPDIPILIRRPTGDTVPRVVSHLAVSGRPAPSDRRLTVLTKAWAPPFQSSDTLIVDARSLRPTQEVFTFNRVRREYRYDGAHVTGTIQFPDSAPQRFDHTYPTPVFAANEVEPLVQALDFRRGLRMIVPLFSEVDHDLERDTLTVIDRTSVGGAEAWVVVFADPVITTRYLVDSRTRALLEAVTTQRTSLVQFRYQYSAGSGLPHRAP